MTDNLYRVEAGYHHRCGGEDFTFVIEAKDKDFAVIKAKEKVREIEQMLVGPDKFEYEVKPLEIPTDGVLQVHHDYYEL